ncbi:hypothetical protein O5D80_001192 [Batrachochytrium dendrobatidis]|nr:hypothetical protein O5D80_001192 [Batrachochytrium dendrobatidis]
MSPHLPCSTANDLSDSMDSKTITSESNGSSRHTMSESNILDALHSIQPNLDAGWKTKRQKEMVRLMLQSLTQLGYSHTALCLQQESGLVLESPSMSQFRKAVLVGDWDLVERLIPLIEMVPRTGQSQVWFLVKKQKYLEFLERHDPKRALSVLRNELSPLSLKQKSNWTGVSGKSREKLLDSLQAHISPSMMIPNKRLENLMDQAVQLQVSECLYHNSLNENISLYANHMCERDDFPVTTTHILEEHTDEVWFLAYSPDGSMLASASKDARAIIWDAQQLKYTFILEEHREAVSFLSWRPDSSMLLTASNDHTLKLWNAKTGACEHTFVRHTEPVTSCAWLPNGECFVSGSLDKNIYLWNLGGDILYKWTGVRIMDLTVSIDGSTLIASSDKKIRLYDLNLRHEIGTLQENDSITSVYVASDGKHLLVNLAIQEIHLWSLEHKRLVRKYVGQKQGRFVIRSCFGGIHDNFILSGSEDSQVYIWHAESGKLMETLEGHAGCVNCVSWNPTEPAFASASDDNTIRIWESLGSKSNPA